MNSRFGKLRRGTDLRRKKDQKSPYDYVLIVCEGSKSEPDYLESLCRYLRINSANVIIAKNTEGTNPLSVLACAIKEHKEDPSYDRVYCVFDKDKHPDFQQAVNQITGKKLGKATYHAITSIPCFEYWLLLHFGYSTKPYAAPEGTSTCALVVRDLKGFIPDYDKGVPVFDLVSDKINDAITNAKRVLKYHETSGTDNPSTKVHELVEYLQKLK